MSAQLQPDWLTQNQRALNTALEGIRQRLNSFAAGDKLDASDRNAVPVPMLDRLCAAFALSPFERDIVLLAAGRELSSDFAAAIADANGGREAPTFGLALTVLHNAHWSALSPGAPLRAWKLIECIGDSALTQRELRIDEQVLHWLTGVAGQDERLAGWIIPLHDPAPLSRSQLEMAARVVNVLRSSGSQDSPLLELAGCDDATRLALAQVVARALGRPLMHVCTTDLPSGAPQRHELAVRLARTSVLDDAMLYVHVENRDSEAMLDLLNDAPGPVLFDRGGDNVPLRTRSRRFVVEPAQNGETTPSGGHWQVDPRIEPLAQRIVVRASWDDLVLPAETRRLLRAISSQVRLRAQVYDEWGFASKSARGLGISALFEGASGTGKTMAAEVLARELALPLLHIDLAAVVSKYIGETEKNLARLFDAAQSGGAILFFDEADALFGKRSEVRDSHDRYANIEVSYLLQRIESYRGLAILATNMESALDPAFVRRLRFIVRFPFPDVASRAEIWRRVFPSATPTSGLEPERLAQLNICGGHIRSIALAAAFLAAERHEPVNMSHLFEGARLEYQKLQRPLTGAETRGWAHTGG